jgi:succinoglycan biosynthesis protein ExoA
VGTPSVTVILPIRNEEKFIKRCLGAILEQDYPADHVEVLIADGMSEDATRKIISELPGSERVRILDNPQYVQATGLNACLAEAKGDVIIRIDGHTVIASDYITQCIQTLDATGAWNVGGAITNTGITHMGKVIADASTSSFGVPGAFHTGSDGRYTDTVYLGAWPRWVFDKVGIFDPSVNINEDYELNYRVRQAGGKIYFTPTIRCQYYGRQTLKALFRQYNNYGKVKVKTLAKHPHSLRLRQLIAPLFVAVLLGGIPFAIFFPLIRYIWSGVIIAYILANLLASIQLASKRNWSLLWNLPIVFFTMHFAWGMGFWQSLMGRLFKR